MKKYFRKLFCILRGGEPPVVPVAMLDKSDKRILPKIPQGLLDKCQVLKSELDSIDENPFSKLERIYTFLDYNAEFVSTFSVCKQGCSACCKSDVRISTLEAKYIEKKTGVKAKKVGKVSSGHKEACPFLKDNSCSIYNERPFNCRTLFTLDDPKYCSTGEIHQLYGMQGGKGVPMLEQFKRYINWLNGRRPDADIRDFFS
ncbi:YkgJ family cysteine cluster protein [Vibrio pomeroyi]|uniref:YkgJ family cysteine cluster protein n=1 Tax=Vibrio pomeroyi TaxID=198832 RepID=A0ABV4MRL5_9VIBR|nr:YkgJ family cysteine cluster protein [Vibrio atlanticus]MCZ4310144.1 YkgJ family cysteine cluster protein [Vibrio atlanticus]